MSYNDSFAFTELEILAGVPAIVYGSWGDDTSREITSNKAQNVKYGQLNYQYYLDKENLVVQDFTLIKIKHQLISKLKNKSSVSEICDELFKSINKIYIDGLVLNYFKVENLESNLIEVSKSPECIPKLVSNVLYKHAEIPFNIETKKSIDREIKGVFSLDISVYNKVGKIQKLIHKTVNDNYESDCHLLLPKEVMRKTLSLCRLNLYVLDYSDIKLKILKK